jgi:hypothetical protein
MARWPGLMLRAMYLLFQCARIGGRNERWRKEFSSEDCFSNLLAIQTETDGSAEEHFIFLP